MPQIQINGELREVSQAEYDALTQNGQASTPAAGSYEQYAAARAKEQAVTKLADGDAAVGETTNISPEFRQELSNIRTSADSAAGSNKDAYAERYAQEQQDLYINAPSSRAALEAELSAPPPTTAPGAVGVGIPYQQGTDAQVVGTLNTANPIPNQPTGSIVSSPVRGLTDGGITSGAPAVGVESAPSYPTEDPQIPPPSTEGAGPFTPPPPPDAAFLQAEVAQEERWQQAAAANPEGIQDNGSVKTVNDAGVATTINRDGSYEVSDANGTFRYDAAGQETSYTTPTVNGVSVTTTADGVQYTRVQQGPLIQETITKDGEPISTTVSTDIGGARLTSIETAGGQPVGIIDVEQGGGVTERLVVDANGEIVSQEQIIRTSKQVASEAEQQAIAENQKLREDLIAAKQQVDSGTPLTAEQTQALEQQAEAAREADAELAAAEQAVAEADPTVVPAGEDPQVDTFVDAAEDPLPSLDTVELDPQPVDTADNPEVAAAEAAQTPEEVPLADIDTSPAPLTEEEIAEYRAQTAVDPGEAGARFQEPFVSDEAAAAEAVYFEENPEAIRAVIDAPEPPVVESQTEEVELSLEELEERVAETEANTELTAEQEAADPEIAPQDDFTVPDSEIDRGDDLVVTDTGGVPTQTLAQFVGEDTGGVPTQSLADIDGDTGFVPLDDPQFGTFGEEDDPFDPDLVTEPDPALFTEEYVQEQDNPVEVAEEQDDGISPYGEEDEPLDEVPVTDPFEVDGDPGYGAAEVEQEADNPNLVTLEAADPYEIDGAGVGLTEEEVQEQDNPVQRQAAQQQATLDRARQQAILQQQRKQANDGDWRVKLRLAPGAQYLYRAAQPGILQPLAVTDGVVFPYTPQIQTAYKANYSAYDLTHSNYRGYFYQGSQVEDIQINAKFTAQDSNEANYLLAVIHFFRSITKMFYGNDPQRGAPPPLVFLQGLGEYQFNLAPCVVAQFNYNLPDNVDYIRAGSPNINGTNLLQRRTRQDLPTNSFSSALGRIQSVLGAQGIRKGAIPAPPAPPTLGTNRPTYVPTAMDISIVLHPIQSRSQVSKQFSLQQYASGDLLKGGFW